ncbi:hypothetical protein PV433_15920 [Paenibacillus sp. GYB004]|uniref:hypothetical protein n=1 Tax=Paenibacillus sp. GYB004 TaxID=2994393 RepID=UPI002F968974
MRKYGVEVQLPKDTKPDEYAGFVQALANHVRLSDRDKELLIVDEQRECALLTELIEEYEFEYEPFELLKLPEKAEVTPLFEDYGFVSLSGGCYLYGHLCAVYRFAESDGLAETAQAVAQMEEHLIARFPYEGSAHYAVDRSLNELMHGIAKAYGCRLQFVRE